MRLQAPWTDGGSSWRSPVAGQMPDIGRGMRTLAGALPSLRRRGGTKALAIGLDPVTASFIRFGNSAGSPSGALSLYEKSTIVAVPIDWIGSAFSSIQPVIKNRETGEISMQDPVLDLLQKPSPHYSGKVFRSHLAINTLATGEVGMVASGLLTRPPVELVPISPKDYEPKAGDGNIAETYRISGLTMAGEYKIETLAKDRVRWVADDLREFRQIRNFSTRDNGLLRGTSPLLAASNEVSQHVLGGEHNVKLLELGGRLSLLFHFKADYGKGEKWDAIVERVKAAYGGPMNAGGIAVTSGENLDIQELGQTAKDMDFQNLQERARMALCLVYRLPLALAFLEAATLDNYRAAKIALWDDAVLPLADLLFDGLTDFLLPRYGRDPKRERITYDERQITALKSRTLEQLKVRKEIGDETIDELRGAQALGPYEPPDPDAEDTTPGQFIYAPSTAQPLGAEPLSLGGLMAEDPLRDGNPEDVPPPPPEDENE